MTSNSNPHIYLDQWGCNTAGTPVVYFIEGKVLPGPVSALVCHEVFLRLKEDEDALRYMELELEHRNSCRAWKDQFALPMLDASELLDRGCKGYEIIAAEQEGPERRPWAPTEELRVAWYGDGECESPG